MKILKLILAVIISIISANTSSAQKVIRCTEDNGTINIVTELKKISGFTDKQVVYLSLYCEKHGNGGTQYYLTCTIDSDIAIGFAPNSSLLIRLGDNSVIRLTGSNKRIEFDKIINQSKDYTWNSNRYPISEEQLAKIGKESILKIRVQYSQIFDIDYFDKVITDGNTLPEYLMAEYVNIESAIEQMETTDLTKDF